MDSNHPWRFVSTVSQARWHISFFEHVSFCKLSGDCIQLWKCNHVLSCLANSGEKGARQILCARVCITNTKLPLLHPPFVTIGGCSIEINLCTVPCALTFSPAHTFICLFFILNWGQFLWLHICCYQCPSRCWTVCEKLIFPAILWRSVALKHTPSKTRAPICAAQCSPSFSNATATLELELQMPLRLERGRARTLTDWLPGWQTPSAIIDFRSDRGPFAVARRR